MVVTGFQDAEDAALDAAFGLEPAAAAAAKCAHACVEIAATHTFAFSLVWPGQQPAALLGYDLSPSVSGIQSGCCRCSR